MQVFGVREQLLHNFMDSSNKIYLFLYVSQFAEAYNI